MNRLIILLTTAWVIQNWLSYYETKTYLTSDPNIVFAELSFPDMETLRLAQTETITVEEALNRQIKTYRETANTKYAQWQEIQK